MSKTRYIVSGLLLTVAALILVVPCSAASDRLLLRINLQAGDSYEQHVTMNQTVTQSFDGQEMDIAQQTKYDLSYLVEKANPDGSLVLAAMYKHIYFKVESPLTTFEFDSANPGGADPMIASPLGALVGKTLTMVMAPSGRVTDVDGVDAILSAMFDGMDPAQRARLEENMKGQLISFERLGGLSAYPEYPLAVGESWSTKESIGGAIPLKVTSTFTLRERRAGMAFIDVNSTITGTTEPVVSGAANITFTLTGTQKGIMEVDERTGLLARGQIEQYVSGDIKIDSGGSVIVVPVAIKSSIECLMP